ncbi:MAG: tricorn protease, partial [Actinomycetota bacterium]
MSRPYLRHPTIAGGTLAFIAEDDVWVASLDGGRAARVTASDGIASFPRLSPDGAQIAYSRQDGAGIEVWAVDADGGEPRRRTWLGGISQARGWMPDGRIVLSSDAEQPFRQIYALHAVDPAVGASVPLHLGAARDVAWGSDGTVVLGRNTTDLARWKRYRAGSAGRLWIDARGTGRFRPLHHDLPNIASPMIVGTRVWFLSDHEGNGNLYSSRANGSDLTRHTDHDEHYARWATTDGERIVYQCAGDVWLHDPATEVSSVIELDVPIAARRAKTTRAKAAASLGQPRVSPTYDLDQCGDRIAVQVRGASATFGVAGGPVRWFEGVERRRLPRFLPDGRVAVVVDDGLEIDGRSIMLPGRAAEVATSATHVAVTTHEHDVVLVDVDRRKSTVIDRSEHGAVGGPTFSHDGAWLAYSVATAGAYIRQLRLHEVATGTTVDVTRAEFGDSRPSFDPTGRYLWFLSARGFAPTADPMGFELHFPRPVRPFVVTLRAEDPDPFHPATVPSEPESVRVDVDGLGDRVRPVPVPAGRYSQLVAVPGGVVLRSDPIEGELDFTLVPVDVPAPSDVLLVTIGNGRTQTLASDVTDFVASGDRTHLLVRRGRALERIPSAGAAPEATKVDLERASLRVDRRAEWRQVFDEAWSLMARFYWTEDMSGIDWDAMRARWEPMLDRLTSRSDLSDVIWELYGELGVGHAYEFGGDYDVTPGDALGALGADIEWDGKGWAIERVLDGDAWDPTRSSALRGPGLDVRHGDRVVAVDGRPLDAGTPPRAALAGAADRDVTLTLGRGRTKRDAVVHTLADERALRYRDWVTHNRRRVHDETEGRCGYVHVPNMGNPGYAEFHRAFYAELGRDALIVDVRYNEGGYVSTLLLEKLLRRRLGWTEFRWQRPEPYPRQSVNGVIVGMCNEHTGSDGDLFSHAFRMLEIGPLVGERT